METLPRAISSFLGDRLITRSLVREIGPRGDRTWNIIVERDGQYSIYNTNAVVIATRSMEAAQLIYPVDPDSSEILKGVGYSPLVVVYTGFKRDSVKHPLDGIGCMVPSKEGLSLLGTLWNSTLFTGRAPDGMVALTNYLGGRRHPEMVDKTDEELLSTTIDDLDKIVGINSPPALIRIIRYRGAIPQYSIGHQDMLRTVEGLPDRIPGLFITGNYLRGISVRDCISYGTRLSDRISKALLQ